MVDSFTVMGSSFGEMVAVGDGEEDVPMTKLCGSCGIWWAMGDDDDGHVGDRWVWTGR